MYKRQKTCRCSSTQGQQAKNVTSCLSPKYFKPVALLPLRHDRSDDVKATFPGLRSILQQRRSTGCGYLKKKQPPARAKSQSPIIGATICPHLVPWLTGPGYPHTFEVSTASQPYKGQYIPTSYLICMVGHWLLSFYEANVARPGRLEAFCSEALRRKKVKRAV